MNHRLYPSVIPANRCSSVMPDLIRHPVSSVIPVNLCSSATPAKAGIQYHALSVIPAKAGSYHRFAVIQFFLSVLLLILFAGCVERTITVRSDPPGALVTINEVEQGRTPVTFPFTWYGDYRVLLELPEYQTLQTHRNAPAPIYQWPVLDFVSEVLLPFTFHDRHNWDFTLTPQAPVDEDALIDRAKDLRGQTENSVNK